MACGASLLWSRVSGSCTPQLAFGGSWGDECSTHLPVRWHPVSLRSSEHSHQEYPCHCKWGCSHRARTPVAHKKEKHTIFYTPENMGSASGIPSIGSWRLRVEHLLRDQTSLVPRFLKEDLAVSFHKSLQAVVDRNPWSHPKFKFIGSDSFVGTRHFATLEEEFLQCFLGFENCFGLLSLAPSTLSPNLAEDRTVFDW